MGGTRKKSGASAAGDDDGLVELVLAHHWRDETGDEPVERKPGDRIRVPRDQVRSMVAAGLVTVDPEDDAAVAEATGERSGDSGS